MSAACHARRVFRRVSRRVFAVAMLLALGAWQPFTSNDPDVTAGNKAYAEEIGQALERALA